MNIIQFRPVVENSYFIEPKPAIQCLPEWYKDSQTYLQNNNFIFTSGKPNATYKKCMPFLDALTVGYFIFLNYDIYVDQTGNSEYYIQWRGNGQHIKEHHIDQLDNLKIDETIYSRLPYKWMNNLYIQTKPGYSCLFTHPLNRLDLPFTTLSGIVDTDKHGTEINFPFLLKKDFHGIIERGTPIIQVIPFKRDNWKMKIGSIYKNVSKYEEIFSYSSNAYKKIAWSRKVYK